MTASKEHDLSPKAWGRNYNIVGVFNQGQQLKCAIWATPMPKVGEFLLLSDPSAPDGRTRYRVETIHPCENPRDMAFVNLAFAPRKAVKP